MKTGEGVEWAPPSGLNLSWSGDGRAVSAARPAASHERRRALAAQNLDEIRRQADARATPWGN
ncbi:hypothetical protein OTB20_24900 [Streptomyces sp. H27-H1]|uniref:hypothetical protein n=1 Tax=Streptomyces sp. H27-H1 TaxID=2996461 RepID=UPI00226DA28F|nr:hypothetical protein [Streptomyces sp. H27-H1]MCY0929379.1 hypothetical protein [Streptomyces sp. H27-H1]